MGLELIFGVGAFVVLAIMLALLHMSDVRDYRDPITQEIIVKANTDPVRTPQEEKPNE